MAYISTSSMCVTNICSLIFNLIVTVVIKYKEIVSLEL